PRPRAGRSAGGQTVMTRLRLGQTPSPALPGSDPGRGFTHSDVGPGRGYPRSVRAATALLAVTWAVALGAARPEPCAPRLLSETGLYEAGRPGPLGFNALQLSTDRDPNAIHGEPLAPGMTTLATLVTDGLMQPARRELVASPPRIHTGSPRTRSVLGYFAANCGTCHNRSGE